MSYNKWTGDVHPLKFLIEALVLIAVLCVGIGVYLLLNNPHYEAGSSCYDYVCTYNATDEWRVGRALIAWSVLYLLVVGVPYGLVMLGGDGRLRKFLRWFWQGQS